MYSLGSALRRSRHPWLRSSGTTPGRAIRSPPRSLHGGGPPPCQTWLRSSGTTPGRLPATSRRLADEGAGSFLLNQTPFHDPVDLMPAGPPRADRLIDRKGYPCARAQACRGVDGPFWRGGARTRRAVPTAFCTRFRRNIRARGRGGSDSCRRQSRRGRRSVCWSGC